ncbi:hypothetical protein A3A76_00050 [Candidatus Woesebacteria bacterium RIFCSPLOWO2_01_FULL_39_23]|uniref:Uncharacterized protein n=1 Tax=Candidatus Woesebacteria bacterium RIFCSPHIGHO2_01_FULL_40_22 TaxID=1802499 RepID=A0A1F7YG06_9BACT|nr:MAG: hypothetical protein A2141_03100 [Candidatus Woesebacteria bacterium RBG_16_40_11]OGM26276.1 MAG: hypothetical protein A2628_03670 [Candidatus Woesebacteria bacterium RIFCSPHIGHO2_01_FULL_40_22]OGM36644.1 MAG: hypothetical protein A3E41_01895 [Candidatus Woesebacteria bacterium RIFCSPHIGHO2_12_FULL_38_9]OGM62831.1 MAG: hypothetical protein A3A76_00050 [Candidatus Woesebacteria bacterium RIFCSPLOWO2_01_FULL_39_23]
MYNHILYLLYWLANILLLLVVGLVFPDNVVLGNFRFNMVESAIYAGFWTMVVFWAMWDYLYVRDIKLDKVSGRFFIFWAFNFTAFWLVSRFSHIAGFGISSFWWALLLGLVANFAQNFIWGKIVERGKSNLSAY